MDATREGQLKRLAKILALRERRANQEAARLASGIAAGSALRADLMAREHRAEFADLTMRSVARTVGILDRGLRVLQQQKTEAVAKAQCARRAGDVVCDHVTELRRSANRKEDEAAASELAGLVTNSVSKTRLR